MKPYPLLLSPLLKDYIWGGNRLINEYGYLSDSDKAAEAWVLSARNDGDCTVLNGELKGKTFTDALKLFGNEVLGDNCRDYREFPLLIKLIDAKDKLSIQVHPDDNYAKQFDGESGKNEMWYVLDCDTDARLVYGFNKRVTDEELEHHIQNDTLDEILNYIEVKKGDVFHIKSGTIHAIGKGILLVEVQQNSNTTYRVSDYGRLGADGKPRELHIAKALDVINCDMVYEPENGFPTTKILDMSLKMLTTYTDFAVFSAHINGKSELVNEDSFIALLLLSGEIDLTYKEGSIHMNKGNCVFIPSNFPINIEGKADFIISCI